MKNKKSLIISLIIVASLFVCLVGAYFFRDHIKEKFEKVIYRSKVNDNLPDKKIQTIKISAAGDCTIGWDDRYVYNGRYDYYLKENNNDYSYYFKNVKDLFSKDDLTIVNLEGDFTDYNVKVEKKFNFKAPKEYRNVLTEGSVEVVSFANNHTHDYGEQGYKDTIDALNEIDMPYYGYDKYLIKEVNGIKIGFFGFLDINGERFNDVKKAINYLKENNCDLIIASMHWGIEYDYEQSKEQVKMGHFLIDNGVDLVIGHHPHIVQGIEKYNNKYIIYSLGNFSFGGNSKPRDMDTFIWQQTFSFVNGVLQLDDNINIIPTYVSSVKNVNNYQPTILEGEEKTKVMEKIMKYSSGFEF